MSADDETTAELARVRAELDAARIALRSRGAEPEPAEPKRLRATDVIDGLLAALSKHGGDRSSVSLTRNARGNTQIEVTVRTGDSASVQTVDECAAEATRVYDALRLLYPLMPDEPTKKGTGS